MVYFVGFEKRITDKHKKSSVTEYKIIPMAQGQKISRFVAWTFFDREQRQKQIKKF